MIYQNTSNENTSDELEEIIFEFYLLNYQQILDSLEQSEKLQEENFEQTLSNDLDHVWVLALKILNISVLWSDLNTKVQLAGERLFVLFGLEILKIIPGRVIF